MTRNMVIGVTVVIAALITGAILLTHQGTDDQARPAQDRTAGGTQKVEDKSETPARTAPAGQYVDYTPGTIANTPGDKILFFHASWCPQCRALEKSIKEGKIPEGATIIKVDYDSNQELRQKYGVTIQTTLVRVDDQGNLVKKYVAYDDPSLQALIHHLL